MRLTSISEAMIKNRLVYHGAPADRLSSIMQNGLVVGSEPVSTVADIAGGRYIGGVYVGDLGLAAGYAIGSNHHGYNSDGHLYEIDLVDRDVLLDTDAFFMLIDKARKGDRTASQLLGNDQIVTKLIDRTIETDGAGIPIDETQTEQLIGVLHSLGSLQLSGNLSGLIVRTNIDPYAIRAVYLVGPANGERFGAKTAKIIKIVTGRGKLRVGQLIDLEG